MKILPCFLYSSEFSLVVGHCCTYGTGTLLIMGSNLISFLGFLGGVVGCQAVSQCQSDSCCRSGGLCETGLWLCLPCTLAAPLTLSPPCTGNNRFLQLQATYLSSSSSQLSTSFTWSEASTELVQSRKGSRQGWTPPSDRNRQLEGRVFHAWRQDPS